MVYENPSAPPRASVVHRYRCIEDEQVLLEELKSEDFDPTAEVLLSRPPSEAAPPEESLADAFDISDSAIFVRDDPQEIR